jgi:DNA-binding response OmpR family regulator
MPKAQTKISTKSSPKTSKAKVLIIEDDHMISNMYKVKFEQEKFEVLVADNPVEGLKIAGEEKPDVVLLDVILPQLDGFETLRRLKEGKTTKNIPVIMLTNLGTDEDKQKGKDLGALDYLVKNQLVPAEVCAIVKSHLKIS